MIELRGNESGVACSIHKSHLTQRAIDRELGGREVLHFLPPYCPDENRIERFRLDLHASVTRNHNCRAIEALMLKVEAYLGAVSSCVPRTATDTRLAA